MLFSTDSGTTAHMLLTGGRLGVGTSPAAGLALDVKGKGQFYDSTATTGVSKLSVRAGAGQGLNNLFEVQDNLGGVIASFDAAGDLSCANFNASGSSSIGVLGGTTQSAGWALQAVSAGFVPLTLAGVTGQTGDLLDCLDGGGALAFAVKPDRSLKIGTMGGAPASPSNGQIYFDAAHLYCRIGGVWKQLDN
jgi:hypothetical protein